MIHTNRFIVKSFAILKVVFKLKLSWSKIFKNKTKKQKRSMGHIAHLRNSSNQISHKRKAMTKLIKKKQIVFFLKNWMVLIEIDPISLDSRFVNSINVFCYFVIITPWKRAGPFIWTNLNPLHQRMLSKLDWIWPSGSGGEDYFKFCQYIFAISLLSPRWKGRGPSYEQIWIPLTQGCVVPSLVEIGPVVLEKKIFKFCQYISLFRYYLPFEKGWALCMNKLESPYQRMLFAKFG